MANLTTWKQETEELSEKFNFPFAPGIDMGNCPLIEDTEYIIERYYNDDKIYNVEKGILALHLGLNPKFMCRGSGIIQFGIWVYINPETGKITVDNNYYDWDSIITINDIEQFVSLHPYVSAEGVTLFDYLDLSFGMNVEIKDNAIQTVNITLNDGPYKLYDLLNKIIADPTLESIKGIKKYYH